MIHPKDVLLNKATGFRYEVCRVGSYDIQCRTLAEPTNYAYPEINRDTLEIVDDAEWELLNCPHTVVPIQTTDTLTERHLAMANNTGRMEATIEILFDRIRSMAWTARVYGHTGVMADCAAMQETITRCALTLQDLPLVNGGSMVPELKAYITARQ